MTQTVSCLYQAREDADAAAAELLKTGFPDHDVHVIAAEGRSDAELDAAIRQAGLRDMHATYYADAIKRGGTLVSLPAQFGCAGLANRIMQKHNPTETGLPEQGYEQRPRDPAAPLSSAWGWRVLLDDPAPLSRLLGVRVLSTDPPVVRKKAGLIDDPAPLSHAINAPLLTEQPAILSAKAGWRVLWGDPAPLSSRFGWPVLTKAQQPTRLAPKGLFHDPAPLSGLFGAKLLSNDPAPLSRLLGWRVLASDPEKSRV